MASSSDAKTVFDCMKSKVKVPSAIKWQFIVMITLLLAIFLYCVVRMVSLPPFHTVAAQNIPLLFAIVVCGVPLLLQLLRKLMHYDLGADLLAGIAIVAGTLLGEYLAVTIVMLMLSTGQILEVYALRKASSVLRALAERMPSTAHRKVNEHIEDIAIKSIKVGDLIVIYPHETCPVDGLVVQGRGSMDESYLTGEPYLVSKAPGASVLSGSVNGEAMLTIRAEKLPQDSRYAKIMKVMEDSEQRRPTFRRLGDQLGAIFAPLSLGIACFAWYMTDDPIRFLAVLVIATPCPLLIAIPITIISAISLAARKGIIIRDPVVLERLPTCKTAIFDKTGTLTYGEAELVKIVSAPEFNKNFILQQVASLERFSKHPLASAILNAAHKARLTLLDVEKVNEAPGQGLVGYVDGNVIQITGREQFLVQHPDQPPILPPIKRGMECVILINNKFAALFRFRDTLRADGYSFINHLEPIHHFEKIMIISGDRASEVKGIAKQLGIREVYANQTPEQKVDRVRQETARAATLFMGDGINDAPALAAATVGIAFGQHNIVTTEAAGAVILESSLGKVDELIHLSILMRRVALISAGGGMILSVIGMYFAAIGMITPVMGALLQEGIDIIAILNALQLTWHSKVSADIAVEPP
jgi:heavy metal translocating P-type ATPase